MPKSKKDYTYYAIYLKWISLHKKTIKESSYIRVKRYFDNYILKTLGDKKIVDINYETVQKAMDSFANETQSYKAIKLYMSKVFEHAIRLNLIAFNPCDYIILPRKNYIHKEENFWNKEELKTFLCVAEHEMKTMWYVFFRLICFTGIRKCEALALTWNDIDFKKSQIRINKTLSMGLNNKINVEKPKTKNSKRIIDLDKKTLSFLYNLKQTSKSKNIIFTNSKGLYISPTEPLRILKNFIRKHHLKNITVHGIRHTHCSILFEAGANVKQIQLRMGHSNIKTTLNIYTHLSKNKKSETIDLYSKYLNI